MVRCAVLRDDGPAGPVPRGRDGPTGLDRSGQAFVRCRFRTLIFAVSLDARVVLVAAYDATTATFPGLRSRLLLSVARPLTRATVFVRLPMVIVTVPVAVAPVVVVTSTRTVARRPVDTLGGAMRVVVVASATGGGGGVGTVTVTDRVVDVEA